MTRPRAADDFATIRSRMEALRRERAEAAVAEDEPAPTAGPRPYYVGGGARDLKSRTLLPRIARRAFRR